MKKERNPLASNVKGVFDLICMSFAPDQCDRLIEKLVDLGKPREERGSGIEDVDGNIIYKGDIVENYAMRTVVDYENGCYVGRSSKRNKLGQKQPIAVNKELRIIGTEWENPELLKEAQGGR